MTIDYDTREEVKTTTSMVEQALTLPVDPSIRQEVRRFGFEYEMLPNDHRDTFNNDDMNDAVDDHMDDWRQERDNDEDREFCCDECEENAFDEEHARFIREYRRHHGTRGSTLVGGPNDLIHRAYANDLIAENARHSYHCDCDSCDYRRSGPLMTAQSDCTVGVEFVSRIIDLNEFDHPARDIQTWVEMMENWDEDGGWMPDGHTSCGNHVHVSSDGDDRACWAESPLRQRAYNNINSLYAAFDWTNIADGGCGAIRGYNSKPQRSDRYGGNWLSDRGYGTFEHRLWNTPREPQRLWAHIGISIGLQRWGFNIAENMPEMAFWELSERDRYGDRNQRITDEVYNALTTNVGEIVRGIRAYIPQHDRFDIARDLIVHLAPTH